MRANALALTAALLFAVPAAAKTPSFQSWIDGTAATESQMQVQRIDGDTYVIRQSVKTNFEAPFLYLLFGRDRVLLLDTGAGGLSIRPTIDGVIADWLAAHHRKTIPMVVAHSHSHGDHRAGDGEFKDRPDTTVVGWTPVEVAAFFKIANWPTDVATYDLGGRVLTVIPTPGHHPSHIMIFDPKARLLLSGDALYPGRLYFPSNQLAAYRDSIDRVVSATEGRHVAAILGAHIEMTKTPGKDLANAARIHTDEHGLALPYADLLELQAALHGMGETPVRQVHDDFIVTPRPPRP